MHHEAPVLEADPPEPFHQVGPVDHAQGVLVKMKKAHVDNDVKVYIISRFSDLKYNYIYTTLIPILTRLLNLALLNINVCT